MTSKVALRQLTKHLAFNTEQAEHDCEYHIELIEKDLKALEIIKKKNVDVSYLVNTLFVYQDTDDEDALEEYNSYQLEKYELTIDEYKLLKEVLCKN